MWPESKNVREDSYVVTNGQTTQAELQKQRGIVVSSNRPGTTLRKICSSRLCTTERISLPFQREMPRPAERIRYTHVRIRSSCRLRG